ncbi:MAG: AAA family ATPase [Planctomycetota bacterium]
MYHAYWGLNKPPFPSGPDRELFHEGVAQREALARLRFLIAHRRRLGLVVGDVGHGKSLLLDVFAAQCRTAGYAVANVDPLGLSTREFYWQLGTQLQARVRVEDDLVRLFRQTSDRINENMLEGRQTIVMLDDLEQAGPDLQNHVHRLLRTEAANTGRLTIIAATDTSQRMRLTTPLRQLCELRIELMPWDELDTVGYLQMALFAAGAERPLFADGAISELHQLSEGVPRRINRLADFALLAGSNKELDTIDAETVREASEATGPTSLV